MAQKTRVQLNQSSNIKFPDNNSKQITAERVRNYNSEEVESNYNLLDDTLSNIRVDDPSFTATNGLDALKEVRDGSDRPLFYIDLEFSYGVSGTRYADVTISGTNYTGTSITLNTYNGQFVSGNRINLDIYEVTGSNDTTMTIRDSGAFYIGVIFDDTITRFGFNSVRESPLFSFQNNTTVFIPVHMIFGFNMGNGANPLFRRINFYPPYSASDYIVND